MTEVKPKRKRVYSAEEKARNQKYKDEHTVQCNLRLNKDKEPELVAVFNSIPNKREFFREALRRYAKEHNIKTEDE